MESNKIILKSAYGKTNGQTYHILPCKDPQTGLYPSHIRECYTDGNGNIQMILSEKDKEFIAKGGILLPADKPIVVSHNKTFDLDNPKDKAEWEAIKHSKLIAEDRLARDAKGNYIIDGEEVHMSENNIAVGRYGLADLYVEHPGTVAKAKNDFRKLRAQAEQYILNDSLEGMITKCKLLEKDMSRANSNDIEDYLFTLAGKDPQKIINLYTGTDTTNRLLLIDAMDKHVVLKRDGLLIYADNIVLGASLDAAVVYLSRPESNKVRELIIQETYPELQKQSKKSKE